MSAIAAVRGALADHDSPTMSNRVTAPCLVIASIVTWQKQLSRMLRFRTAPSPGGRRWCPWRQFCALAWGRRPCSEPSRLPCRGRHGVDSVRSSAAQWRRANRPEVVVDRFAATKSFYAPAFGWGFTDYGPTSSGFENAGLGLRARRLQHDSPSRAPEGRRPRDALARVEAASGEITAPMFEFPGGRRFQVRNPADSELGVWGK